MALFQSIKDAHLKAFLEDEYSVKIFKKYGAYLVIKDNIIVNFAYTLQQVREFLENKPNFNELLLEGGLPEKVFKKWERKQYTGNEEDLSTEDFEESIEKELSKEELAEESKETEE